MPKENFSVQSTFRILDCALEVYAKERRVFVMNNFAVQCMFQNDIRRAWRNMSQLVSQLLFHTIHDACRIFDKLVAFLVFLVLL